MHISKQGVRFGCGSRCRGNVRLACARPGGRRGVQLGPRPSIWSTTWTRARSRATLQQCAEGPFASSDFSIGHRGAALQFPEHTKESYEAAARMGAGILECDVTFTKDRQLVCRHAQCDLHTTTNILAIPELAAKCTQPFTPADPADRHSRRRRKCCTSDITLAEFKTPVRQDGRVRSRTPPRVEEYLDGTAELPHRPLLAPAARC